MNITLAATLLQLLESQALSKALDLLHDYLDGCSHDLTPATIQDAPEFLNINDKAMWVLGYNEAIAKLSK